MRSFECCHYCEDRVVGCHSHCDKYIRAKAKHDAINKRRRDDAIIENHLNNMAAKKFEAIHKSKKEW